MDTINSFLRTVGFGSMGASQANGNAALAEVLDGPDKSFNSEPMALETADANGNKDGSDDYYGTPSSCIVRWLPLTGLRSFFPKFSAFWSLGVPSPVPWRTSIGCSMALL